LSATGNIGRFSIFRVRRRKRFAQDEFNAKLFGHRKQDDNEAANQRAGVKISRALELKILISQR